MQTYMDKNNDLTLIGTTLMLLGWGTVMVYSTSAPFAEIQYQNSHFFLQRHLIHIVLGTGTLLIGLRLDYHNWRQWGPWLMIVMFVMLILVLLPEIGLEVNGARRWLRFSEIGFQPVELLKLVLIIYIASFLERKQELLASFFRGPTPIFLTSGAFLFLVLMQPDFGSAVLIAMTVLMMLYVGGGRPIHIFGSLLGMSLIGILLISSHAYRVRRMLAFLNPWDDPLNSGFQIIQSYIALGTGGWFGRGLGESHQKLFFLPDSHTDFIFAIVGEELGFVWVCALVGLFALFIWRGYWISWNAPDSFGQYLAFGVTTILSLHIILNLFVVTGLLPTKGLPLPFISYGGTNLLSTLFMTGILLNISRQIIPYRVPPGQE